MIRLQIQMTMAGIAAGNFQSPKAKEDRMPWLMLVEGRADYESKGSIRKVFIPRFGFTTNIAHWENDDVVEAWNSFVVRTEKPADGVIINRPFIAGAMCIADCPVVILHGEHLDLNIDQEIGVFHCALKCVVRDNGAPGILHHAFHRAFNPQKTKAHIAFGIGPCCYGLNVVPRGVERSFIHQATTGPRKGKQSVDLYTLIKNQLLAIGVPEKNIAVNPLCTACAKNDEAAFVFHSHTRDGADAGRNLIFVWLEFG